MCQEDTEGRAQKTDDRQQIADGILSSGLCYLLTETTNKNVL